MTINGGCRTKQIYNEFTNTRQIEQNKFTNLGGNGELEEFWRHDKAQYATCGMFVGKDVVNSMHASEENMPAEKPKNQVVHLSSRFCNLT